MMLALLADVHANLEALEACLKHARRNGATKYVFLGDLVGYGADPAAVVEVVQRHAEEGAILVQGNHDAAVAGRPDGMGEEARSSAAWTRAALDRAALRWLGSLPLCVHEGQMCFVHASAARPSEWEYVEDPGSAAKSAAAARATWTFSGHVHRQMLFFGGARMTAFKPTPGAPVPVRHTRRWLAIAGSVGQPRERNPAAAYALFDTAHEVLTFQRVPYDHLAAARKIRAAGLPHLIPWRGS